MPNVDMTYEIIMWNNPVNYYNDVVNKTDLYGYYIKECNIMDLSKNELYRYNIRFIFDDRV